MQRRDTQCHLPAWAPRAFQGKHRPQSPALADLGPFETHDVMSSPCQACVQIWDLENTSVNTYGSSRSRSEMGSWPVSQFMKCQGLAREGSVWGRKDTGHCPRGQGAPDGIEIVHTKRNDSVAWGGGRSGDNGVGKRIFWMLGDN